MKLIPLHGKLGEGKFAVVDDEDFDLLNQWSWQVNNSGYIRRTEKKDGVHRTIYMSRLVMCYNGTLHVEHKDRNKLNNQKNNLRLATPPQNGANKKKISQNKDYKGIYRHKDRWYATIIVNKEVVYLGVYANQQDAAIAYNKAAKVHYGEFALLNEVDDKVIYRKSGNRKGSSKYIGVTRLSNTNKWKVTVSNKDNGKNEHFGYYNDELVASHVYDYHAIKRFGEKSCINHTDFDYINYVPPEPDTKKKTSNFRGVSFVKKENRWKSAIQVNKKNNYLGMYDTPEEAAQAYDNFVITNNLKRKLNFGDD